MSSEIQNFESLADEKMESAKTRKEIIWKKREEEIEKTVDAKGKPVDGRIKETVVTLNVMGLATDASCEGHSDRGIPAPWIKIAAPGEPEEQFSGQKEIFQKTAERYGLPIEDVIRDHNDDAWKEAWRESAKNEEAPEYRKWTAENKTLMDKAADWLAEFYRGRGAAANVRLQIEEIGGSFEIHNGGEDYRPLPEDFPERSEEERSAQKERLARYQKEMEDFGKFLKNKFFGTKSR